MGKRTSPSSLIQQGVSALPVLASLDPRDQRTKNFKLGVTRQLGAEAAERTKIESLGTLSGNTQLDWETPYVKRLKPELNRAANDAVANAITVCDGDASNATTHALGKYVKPILDNNTQRQNDEFIRRVVSGIAANVT